MTESEATKFAALYAQIEHIDRDLTPAELYAFTTRDPRLNSRATVTILAWKITHQPQPEYMLISFDLMSECLEDIDVEGECEYMC